MPHSLMSRTNWYNMYLIHSDTKSSDVDQAAWKWISESPIEAYAKLVNVYTPGHEKYLEFACRAGKASVEAGLLADAETILNSVVVPTYTPMARFVNMSNRSDGVDPNTLGSPLDEVGQSLLFS